MIPLLDLEEKLPGEFTSIPPMILWQLYMNASQLFPGRRDVPIYRNIMEVPEDYDTLIVGSAPIGGKLPKDWREEIKFAIREGKTIVSGLHDFLSEDDEFRKLAEEYGAKIWDVRKPPENLRVAY